MNWHIGQEVVWVGLRGNECKGPTKITGIRNSICNCRELEIETDLVLDRVSDGRCGVCNMLLQGWQVGKYRSERCYCPLDYNSQEIALLKSIAETGIHVKELTK